MASVTITWIMFARRVPFGVGSCVYLTFMFAVFDYIVVLEFMS